MTQELWINTSHVDLYRADSMPPKLWYERPLRHMSRSYFPFYLLWKTLLRLMNQANPNSDGPAATSARLSTTHTMKQSDHLTVFSMLSRILFYVFARTAETELALPQRPSHTS